MTTHVCLAYTPLPSGYMCLLLHHHHHHHQHPTPLGTIWMLAAHAKVLSRQARVVLPLACCRNARHSHTTSSPTSIFPYARLRTCAVHSHQVARTSSRQFIVSRRSRVRATCSFESIIVLVTLLLIHRDPPTIAVLHLAWTGPFSVDRRRGQCWACNTNACKPCASANSFWAALQPAVPHLEAAPWAWVV